MLEVDNLHIRFGGLSAVTGVSIRVEAGSITGLIGPNGAGKTTLFNACAGSLLPTAGRIVLDGQDITRLAPHQRFARGLLRSFQIAHEFSSMTVRDNLLMVPAGQRGERLWDALFAPRVRLAEQDSLIGDQADMVLDFLQLSHLATEAAGNLSGGQKKLLELGRTMMVPAKIVLLDEIGAGVNRSLLRRIEDAILRLRRDFGYTFFLIEHDMDMIQRLCDPVIVMAQGQLLMQGSAAEVVRDERVIESYLGHSDEGAA